MKQNNLFIIRLNWADLLSLLALFLSSLALVTVLEKKFFLAISLLFLGMFADTFDGMIARKYGLESEFGRYLDGFVDVVTYLMAPVLFLYVFGYHDLVSLLVYFIFITAGILRLAKFNIIGTVKEGPKMYYTGLPVFWSLFLLVTLFGLSFCVPKFVHTIISDTSLLSVSFLMIVNKPFIKPRRYFRISLMVILIVAVFLYLHLKFG
ncbi:MAG TPA: CDP-alcohol phosphatidyltransferase family protein [Bacillota bacterium]|nr:CDP-alcohol phosphatidyltransferase family protein [Bacillota bacterium]